MILLNMEEIIIKKRDGKILGSEEINFFINGYTKGEIPDYQASALLMSIYFQGLSEKEITDLTEAMMLIMDSLAGAANLGDIGELFPDNRKCYEGISSLTLLKKVAAMCKERGYEIGNIDTVIIAQSPKLNSFKSAMAENLANVLSLPVDSINIKATTTENLGFEGRKEGIAAQAVAILLPKYEGNEDI